MSPRGDFLMSGRRPQAIGFGRSFLKTLLIFIRSGPQVAKPADAEPRRKAAGVCLWVR